MILEFEEVDTFAEKIPHPILKSILKYSKQPTIIAINNVTNKSTFQFSCVSKQFILNESNTASYADDNTLYKACDKVHTVVETSRMPSEKAI